MALLDEPEYQRALGELTKPIKRVEFDEKYPGTFRELYAAGYIADVKKAGGTEVYRTLKGKQALDYELHFRSPFSR
jgi:hypothetical protein